MAVRYCWSQPIYSARLHNFFRHLWLNFSKGSLSQLTTFPEDLFIFPWMEISHTSAQDKETNTVDPGTLTSPVIGHVTAGLLSVTAFTFRRVLEGGGGTWGSSKTGKVFNATCTLVSRPFFCLFSVLLIRARPGLWKSLFLLQVTFQQSCHHTVAFLHTAWSQALPLVFKRKSLVH